MQREHGNVLFLILIAVALFGALAYAVTSSMRSGGGDTRAEQTLLIGSQLVQYGAGLANSVLRMTISNGCSAEEINFETPLTAYDYSPVTSSSEACKVFSSSGGGATYQEVPAWFDPVLYTPGYSFYVMGEAGIPDIGTSAADLVVTIQWTTLDVCNSINKKIIGANYSGIPPTGNVGFSAGVFKGVYGSDGTYLFDPSLELRGQPQGCLFDPGGNYYYVYYVLMPR